MSVSPLYASSNVKSRPAIVVTRNASVYHDAARTLATIGAAKVMHMSPAQLLATSGDVFWVIDARVPGAQDLIRELLTARRDNGLVLSAPSMGTFNKFCVKHGVPALLMHSLVERPVGADKPMLLSARETQIVRLISFGRTNDEIGAALGITGLTVKSHVARMLRKTGANDRSHMVLLSLRAGLID
jgi:DNA-binding CsgD family transcriptional regulator